MPPRPAREVVAAELRQWGAEVNYEDAELNEGIDRFREECRAVTAPKSIAGERGIFERLLEPLVTGLILNYLPGAFEVTDDDWSNLLFLYALYLAAGSGVNHCQRLRRLGNAPTSWSRLAAKTREVHKG